MTASRDTKTSARKRVMIVDDHTIVRHGLSHLIGQEPDLDVCCQTASAEEALEAMENAAFDLIITDISLPGISGIELTRAIEARHPDLPVLVISMHDESLYAERAYRAGAKGYVMKQEATEKMLLAVRKVLNGEVYLSDRMQTMMLERFREGGSAADVSFVSNLSDREFEVLQLIGQGMGTSEIAAKLSRSVKTIEAHRAALKLKLKLKNASELAKFAANWVAAQDKQ